jgi:ubiquinone/menaquinone biosynthesis C-methylase UbiE
MLRSVKSKTLSEIVAEWDALAPLRHQQISSGVDISYSQVIAPALMSLVMERKPTVVLDAGCGIGSFTARLEKISKHIVGVDPSEDSLAIARTIAPQVAFVHDTLENFSLCNQNKFDVVVANMVLMDVMSLTSFLEACRRVVIQGGALAFSITHPCFWPEYYGYGSADWFHYEDEIIIESSFRISADRVGSLISTHIHRPLSAYIEAFNRAGFSLKSFKEPMPPDGVDKIYRSSWKSPRYIAGICSTDSVKWVQESLQHVNREELLSS